MKDECLSRNRFEQRERFGENVAPNPFVSYLNSLHSRDAGNENALAELQACNPDFSRIHVKHPLVAVIMDCLNSKTGQSIVLTGHAGDGKSTLAITIYKILKGLDESATLTKPLERRENITLTNGERLAIVKDLSEWRMEEKDALISEVLNNKTRVLLVTNTGALLDAVCGYAERNRLGSWAEWEDKVLTAMDAESNEFIFGTKRFLFFNLALFDNLSLARHIFERMLSMENWNVCDEKDCHWQCPIYRNVTLISEEPTRAIERLFLAYRRMYEYGMRLTIRQLTAHFAYMLTSGLEYADICALAKCVDEPLISEYLFFNRFFGDNGRTEDQAGSRMKVVREVKSQGFGEQPSPTIERNLWLLTQDNDFKIGIPLIEEEFQKLRRYGAMNQPQDRRLTPDQARGQVRRMLYFLHDFQEADRGDDFLRRFLGSPAILKWKEWQSESARLSMDETSHFKQRVFHVLQEQFTGVRLPEIGDFAQNYLYITLSQHRQSIRQSAQVVLAQVDFENEFQISLSSYEENRMRRDLMLEGQGRLHGVRLMLSLPFLDYVLARHQGELRETIQAAYADRLERLKADLIRRCQKESDLDDNIMLLVRLQTNNTFVRQRYAITQGGMEVSYA